MQVRASLRGHALEARYVPCRARNAVGPAKNDLLVTYSTGMRQQGQNAGARARKRSVRAAGFQSRRLVSNANPSGCSRVSLCSSQPALLPTRGCWSGPSTGQLSQGAAIAGETPIAAVLDRYSPWHVREEELVAASSEVCKLLACWRPYRANHAHQLARCVQTPKNRRPEQDLCPKASRRPHILTKQKSVRVAGTFYRQRWGNTRTCFTPW